MSASPGAVPLSTSKVIRGLMRHLERQLEERGEARVMLCGPPSGPTIETFSALGCKVTVDGERIQSVPLEHADESFDLLLVFDQVDFADDEAAQQLADEWGRVLRPGGRIYLLMRQDSSRSPGRLRVDVHSDGSLQLREVNDLTEQIRCRSNRQIERLLGPIRVDEISLRRDGLREVSGRKKAVKASHVES